MKRVPLLVVAMALMFPAHDGIGQQHQKDPRPTLAQMIDAWVTITENHVVPVAEVMPEEKYGFAPTAGEFRGVRTFAQQLKHLAVNNYYVAAVILGQKAPEGSENETGPDSVQSKAEIIRYVRGSFDSLHQAVAAINDKNMTEPIPGTSGSWQRNRVTLVIDGIAHSFNHYGQLVEYLRMNGIVPPDSR